MMYNLWSLLMLTCLLATNGIGVYGQGTSCTFNEQCDCHTEIDNSLTISCTSAPFETFPTFTSFYANNTVMSIIIQGNFSSIPANAIYQLVGEGCTVRLSVIGIMCEECEELSELLPLSIDAKAFSTEYDMVAFHLSFSWFKFSPIPTEALALPSINDILFSSCSIPTIKNNSFDGFTGRELAFGRCDISSLEPHAFMGAGPLDNLMFSNNPFTTIAANELDAQTLNLDLSGSLNNISQVGDYSFCKCNKPNSCPNIIEKISLSGNPVTSISSQAFANLPKLTNLILSYCNLVSLSAFHDLPSLSFLDLKSNQITIIEAKSFSNLPNLLVLSLDENPITTIKPGAFNGLTWDTLSIKGLYQLLEVDAAITSGMKSVTSLVFLECPNMENLLLNDYTQLPKSLNSVIASNLNLSSVSSNFDSWLQSNQLNSLDISSNYFFNCTSDIQWMAKYTLCPNIQINMTLTTCADSNRQLLSDYLKQLEPSPNCNFNSSSRNVSMGFLMFLFCYCLLSLIAIC